MTDICPSSGHPHPPLPLCPSLPQTHLTTLVAQHHRNLHDLAKQQAAQKLLYADYFHTQKIALVQATEQVCRVAGSVGDVRGSYNHQKQERVFQTTFRFRLEMTKTIQFFGLVSECVVQNLLKNHQSQRPHSIFVHPNPLPLPICLSPPRSLSVVATQAAARPVARADRGAAAVDVCAQRCVGTARGGGGHANAARGGGGGGDGDGGRDCGDWI